MTVHCFGNFEVFVDGEAVKFKYARTRDVFAYLVDRQGALVSTNEILAALFEEDIKGSYFRNLKADLTNTLQTLGVGEVIVHERGRLGIHHEKVDCDYFAYLDGRTDLFHGEYMTQYSFAEGTLACLLG